MLVRTVPVSPDGPGAPRGGPFGHTDALLCTSYRPCPAHLCAPPCPEKPGFTPDATSRQGGGGTPVSPPGRPHPLAATLHKAAHSRQLPAPLCSSKYCISCGGPGLRALLQLGRLGSAAGRRNRDYVSWAQSSKGQKAALGGVRSAGE